MKVKVIVIPEFKIGDQVTFTPEVIKFYEKFKTDKKNIKLYGSELLEKTLANHKDTHTIEAITMCQDGSKAPLIWLKGRIGSAAVRQLIKS